MTGEEFRHIRCGLEMSQAEMGHALGRGRKAIMQVEKKDDVPKVYEHAVLSLRSERMLRDAA